MPGKERDHVQPHSSDHRSTPATSNGKPWVGDLGYYAPQNRLVLYYGEVGSFPGIVRIGRSTSQTTAMIREQNDGFRVTLTS